MIKTSQPFDLSDAVKPVCLPSLTTRPDDMINRQRVPVSNMDQKNDPICVISGYGDEGTNYIIKYQTLFDYESIFFLPAVVRQ